MYKRAWGLRRFSDRRDEQDDREFRRPILEAAGIDPPASSYFIFEIELTLLLWGARRHTYVQLANKLNRSGKLNAKGGYWNHRSIMEFMNAFLPKDPTVTIKPRH